MMKIRASMVADLPTREPDIDKSRKQLDKMLAPQVAGMLARYPVTVREDSISGVPVWVVTPEDGEYDDRRVLINLHGGAFNTCWHSWSLPESAPVSVVGGFKVVSVNYRMAPEASHPAGVEDVATVQSVA